MKRVALVPIPTAVTSKLAQKQALMSRRETGGSLETRQKAHAGMATSAISAIKSTEQRTRPLIQAKRTK